MGQVFTSCCNSDEEIIIDEDGNQISVPKKAVGKEWLTHELKTYLKSVSPKDFLSLAKAKKVLLTQEQKAAMEKDYEAFADTNPNDVTPAEFVETVEAYLKEANLIESSESLSSLVSLVAPTDLLSLLKFVGETAAPYMPAPSTVGKIAGKYSKGDKIGGKSPKRPVEALHFKAVDSGILDRYQAASINGRRPSVSALPCRNVDCKLSTFNLSGYCKEHHQEAAEDPEIHIEKLKSGEIDPKKQELVEKSLEEKPPTSVKQMSDKVSTSDKMTKTEKSLKNYITATNLRKEMSIFSNEYFTSVKSQENMKEGRKLLDQMFQHIGDDEISQFYWQFKLFDLDKDGFITIEDLKGLVAYVDPLLPAKPDFHEKCMHWFGRQTFYPLAGPDEDIEIKVSFQHYVTSLLVFRMQTESHGIFDNLLFPFWSLRDCIIYSAHRNLDGWAYKRASGISGSWKKRHFRMCQDDESGSNICLEYYIDDDSSTPIRKTINLRTLLSVTFSPETSLPKGKDVPSDLVCFKLVLNDGQRFCLAADHHTAIKWTSIFSWYACAGRIITEWRIQYGDLTKDKISTRDWINAGIVIVNMTSYVSLQEKFKEAIASVLLESSKNKLSDSAKKLALAVTVRKIARTAAKTYVAPRQRLILKLCGISEQNLQNSLQLVQCGIFMWRQVKGTVWSLDSAYLYGGVKTSIFVFQNGIVAYKYGVATKNAYKQHRYLVDEWQDRSSTRECSVCKEVFKSLTIRSAYKKHHCRSCGRIVCHACSTHKVYFEVTGKIRRVCDECILTGKPTKAIDPLNPSEAVTSKAIESKAVVDDDNDSDEDEAAIEDEDVFGGIDENHIDENSADAKYLASVAKQGAGAV